MKTKTYIQIAYDHLMEGKGLSPAFFYKFTGDGCMRLADVIFRLKARGVDIKTQDCEYNGKRFARYTIVNIISEQQKNLKR